MRAINRSIAVLLTASVLRAAAPSGSDPGFEPLPPPDHRGGRPLMQVLADRQSQREFQTDNLPRAVLGNLLWAAFGVNRPGLGNRTAPSAMNSQDVSIYVALRGGVFRYNAENHGLVRIHDRDVRTLTGGQDYVKTAPVALVFVSDEDKLTRAPAADKPFYGAVDTGYVSQNVYLFCASEGLSTVVHMAGGGDRLREALQLRPAEKIILAQSVGYPVQREEVPQANMEKGENMESELSYTVELAFGFDESIEHVQAALKQEGFGVISRINLHQAFKEKIGKDFRPYTILGTCNPNLAHQAVSARPEVGLLLPCNVTVEAIGDRRCRVSILNPKGMMKAGGMEGDPVIRKIGEEADERLARVAQALAEGD